MHAPEVHVRFNSANRGMLDIRDAANLWAIEVTGKGIQEREDIESWVAYLDLNYMLDNGIELSSMTAHTDYSRNFKLASHRTAYFARYQNRDEHLSQWTQEFRITSPSGGMLEWMAGVYYQLEDYDFSLIGHEADIRMGLRVNDRGYQDAEWLTGFLSTTFNFMDNRASIDLGVRYSEVDKTGFISGWAVQWVYDVMHCVSSETDYLGTGNTDPATYTRAPGAVQLTPEQTLILIPGADTDNLWIMPYHFTRNTPVNWRGSRASAVGISNPSTTDRVRPGEGSSIMDSLKENSFDPQITLRYRPTDEMSLYVRWAQAFKAGGFDTGVSSIVTDGFTFQAETARIYEAGAKGSLWYRRASYELTVYKSQFSNLQLRTANPIFDDIRSINTNAGGQRIRGVDLSLRAAVTDRLMLSMNAALMDSVMTDYAGAGCSDWEFQNPGTSGCDTVTDRIDRTGSKAPFSPDWKVVFDARYEMPVLDRFMATLTAKAFLSDGYFTNYNTFTRDVEFNTHGDINLNLSFGDQARTWKVSAYGRNLLQARPRYKPEFDVDPRGILISTMSASKFQGLRCEG